MLGTVGLCVRLLFTDKPKRKPFKPLFDFSASQDEGWRLQALLREALAASATDEEFRRAFDRALAQASGDNADFAWTNLGHSLMEYRQAHELEPRDRTLAERLLNDIPRRYKLKNSPDSGP